MNRETLLKIAKNERRKDFFIRLNAAMTRSRFEIPKCPDAIVWEGGLHDGNVIPIGHAITDEYSLVGTVAAAEILGLPWHGIPFMAQDRHDRDLAPLKWLGNYPGTSIKWSTAGDRMVKDASGKPVVVKGKSGNAKFRTEAGVFCNVRPYGEATCVRYMPGLPYSQNKTVFEVTDEGIVHSEMNTPGIRMAYAARHFLKLVHESGGEKIGRTAIKPTQAMEDGILAGLLYWLLEGTQFTVKKHYKVNPYEEHKERIAKIIALLPPDFKDGMDQWSGDIYMHIADLNYGQLLRDELNKQQNVILATDLDGDRLTDLMVDTPDAMRTLIGLVAGHLGHGEVDTQEIWEALGHTTTDGRDMDSTMFTMDGRVIFEQTLGTAGAMLDRLVAGDETVDVESGATGKKPYNWLIHFTLTAKAYKHANPDNDELHRWLDAAVETASGICAGQHLFLDSFDQAKAAITPWGQ